ncbi:MAG: C1 family peptidase, partial [Gemmatimonadaceae bacterium]
KSRSTKRARAGAPLAPDTGFDPLEPGTTTRLCTPVRNQNTSDLCIAFAVAAAMEAAVGRHRQTTNKAPEINVDHVFRKNGAQVGSVQTIQGAVASGVFDVDCLPFGATQPCTDVAAHTWKCDLRPLQAPKKERVALLKQQLRDVGPLVALIQVFSNFASYDKVEPYVPKKPSAGFHAVCIVGYEVDAGGTTGRWIVKNSLGPGWGDQGFFRLPWGQELVKPEDVVFVAADVHQ